MLFDGFTNLLTRTCNSCLTQTKRGTYNVTQQRNLNKESMIQRKQRIKEVSANASYTCKAARPI